MFDFITPELLTILGIAICGGLIGYIIGYNHGSNDASDAWKSVYAPDVDYKSMKDTQQ